MVTPRSVNIGPLYKPDGTTPLASATITFTLVDGFGKNTAGYEQATNAQVAGVISAITNASGLASVSLVPNDQLAGTTYYQVNPADAYGHTRFRAYLASGAGAIDFADIYISSQNPAPGEWSAFSTHAQDETKHLTSNEDAALAAANSPSAGNPMATMADTAAGAFTNLTDTPASYTSQSGKVLSVKATEDGVEFSAAGSGDMVSTNNLSDLSDAPTARTNLGLGNVQNLQHDLAATTAPAATDDSGTGYAVGSLWIDTTNDRVYVCLDATVSAAIWREIGVKDYRIDDFYTFTVNVHDPATGAAEAASGSVTYRVYEDETATAILTGTMTALDGANTTGFYSEQIQLTAANGFEEGKSYNVYIEAGVGGVTGSVRRFLKM